MSHYRPHTWWRMNPRRSTKPFNYVICTFCGLVLLRNAATERLVRKGCFGAREEDTQ